MVKLMIAVSLLWSLLLLTETAAIPTKPVNFVFPSASAPAPKPASTPTKPSPTASTSFSISTDKITYSFNTTVSVSFTNPRPQKDDFIAIYRVWTPTNSLGKGLFWLYTCNQQAGLGCWTAKGAGTVTFGPKGPKAAWGINWPLPAGEYRAYLLRNSDNPPYTAIAQSKVFTVIQSFDDAFAGAKKAIATLVTNNVAFLPKFLRLIFHDCIGGCDGCIDMTNPENAGLIPTIDVLTMVSDAYANNYTGLSRADVWSLSGILAVDLANKAKITRPINFTFDWVGRVNCEDGNKVCKNAKGAVVACSPKAGPHRNTPGPQLNTSGLFSFFSQEFGFNKEQTVAVMGAHSVGALFRVNSGIDGPDGWQSHNRQVRSEYFEALLGTANARSNGTMILEKVPKWSQMFLNNTKFKVPDRWFWRLHAGKKNLTMTNADIAMVRLLDNSNMNPVSGKVNCAFNPTLGQRPLCPLAPTLGIVKKFANNDDWLAEFNSVLELLTTNGYVRKSCAKKPCRLVRKTL